LKLLLLGVGAVMLAGCSMQLPHLPEMGFNWVSTEGKSQDQLYQDQIECRREVSLIQSPDPANPGAAVWGMSQMKAFDDCMRTRGWEKK
jgi:hypothetical protein